MDKERIKRYNEKLEHLNQMLENLKKWTKNIRENEFSEKLDLTVQYAIYYAFSTSVEASTDLVAMIVKDLKIITKDDYSNIDILKDKKIINYDLAKKLKEANGLRNRVIHGYNKLDEVHAYGSIIGLLDDIEKFKEAISKWLKKYY